MSNLIAVAYDDVDGARNVLRTLEELGTPDKVLPRISPYGGRVIHSSFSDEAEAHLREALSVPAS